jgi:hypothetical protein
MKARRNPEEAAVAQARVDLDALTAKLRHAQADYDWARSRGDVERAAQARIKLQGVIAEHERLIRQGCTKSSLLP